MIGGVSLDQRNLVVSVVEVDGASHSNAGAMARDVFCSDGIPDGGALQAQSRDDSGHGIAACECDSYGELGDDDAYEWRACGHCQRMRWLPFLDAESPRGAMNNELMSLD